MGKGNVILGVFAAAFVMWNAGPAQSQGDSMRGQRLFRACVACHSLEPDRHLTGPSLSGIWGRKAGSVEGFARYSDALKSADVVWNAQTLDRWLADPGRFIPRNAMTFPGIPEAAARADLLAYLQAVGAGSESAAETAQAPPGPTGGMMSPTITSLKSLAPNQRIESIRYCRDTYRITTTAGETTPFWEFNIRFKTDSGDNGPVRGRPALLRGGMMGDRVFVVFASPREIGEFIEVRC